MFTRDLLVKSFVALSLVLSLALLKRTGGVQGAPSAPPDPGVSKEVFYSVEKNLTIRPSMSPTKNLTKSPSMSPTKNLTKSPSMSPTKNLTKSPTKSLTKSPTKSLTPGTITSYAGKVCPMVEYKRTCHMSLIHIPKTAGTSFYEQYRKSVHFQRRAPGNDEASWAYLARDRLPLACFFREPRSHVYSMYLECKWDDWGIGVTNNTGFPRDSGEDETQGYMPDFDRWLSHFVDARDTISNFRCYQPVNMQTRYITTDYVGNNLMKYHNYLADGTSFNAKTRARIKGLWFIGLKEYYRASTCLFEYQVSGKLSDECDCTNGAPAKPSPPQKHVTHGVPPHPMSRLDPKTLDKIDKLVDQDVLLYDFAKNLFWLRIDELERKTGKHICGVPEQRE